MSIKIGAEMKDLIQLAKKEYSYNPTTGEFKKIKGRQISAIGSTGLRVNGVKFARTKLAWIIHYNELPKSPIKQIDGDVLNMRIDNLVLMDKSPRAKYTSQYKLDANDRINNVSDLIAGKYDESIFKVVNIAGPNKAKLNAIGYDLPLGVGYNWLVKIDDLISIGSNETVNVSCKCGKQCQPKAFRAQDYKCRSCCMVGKVHSLEHRRNNSRAKRDETLTDEERVSRRSMPWMKSWAKEVKVKANYTCEMCGQVGGKLQSHHKDSYRSNEMRRTDITNGVCLCEECHKDFHKQYGQGKNTVAQFEDWVLNKFEEMEVA